MMSFNALLVSVFSGTFQNNLTEHNTSMSMTDEIFYKVGLCVFRFTASFWKHLYQIEADLADKTSGKFDDLLYECVECAFFL